MYVCHGWWVLGALVFWWAKCREGHGRCIKTGTRSPVANSLIASPNRSSSDLPVSIWLVFAFWYLSTYNQWQSFGEVGLSGVVHLGYWSWKILLALEEIGLELISPDLDFRVWGIRVHRSIVNCGARARSTSCPWKSRDFKAIHRSWNAFCAGLRFEW